MISASIVLYDNKIDILKKTVDSFLQTPVEKKLYLIDNSTSKSLQEHFKNDQIEYIFVGKNIGFGKAHNLILDTINSDYHLILNPDVEFSVDVLPSLIHQLKNKDNTVFITPKVKYPNQAPQFICRKHPTFFDLINRKIKFSEKKFQAHQYAHKDLSKPFYPEFIHGCFMLFKTKELKTLQGFDKRYFLYMEDADLCRKIDASGKKKLYFPEVEIIHQHQKGSSKKPILFYHHFISAIKYFLKWGF